MLVKTNKNREQNATDYPGIERSLSRNNDTGDRSSVVRFAAGGQELHTGDYVCTEPGKNMMWSPFPMLLLWCPHSKAHPPSRTEESAELTANH